MESDLHASVDSAPVRTALALLDEYLTPRPGAGHPPGNVVSVAGEFGTGKTHLAARIMARCRDTRRQRAGRGPTAPVRAVYLDIAVVGADQLYRHFVESLPRDEVISCVRDYYIDLVAATIGEPGLARRAEQILRDPELLPAARDGYIAQLGLSQTALLEQLRSTLATVVGNADYAIALTMLLREGMEGAAWDWLRGADPAAILRERGLSSPVPADVSAISIFARLYAQQGHRLVLVFDELEEGLLTGGRAWLPSVIRRTLDQLSWAGSLIFLIGLPEVFEAPDLNLAKHIGSKIRMANFDTLSTAAFIRASLGTDSLRPFTHESVERIVALTGGNPHRIVILCRRLYQAALDRGHDVSDDMVRKEALDYFAATSKPHLAAVIRRVLDGHLWDFRSDYPLTIDAAGRVDFWIPVNGGPDPAGCAILIVDAVESDDDVRRLSATADALNRESVRFQALVVVASGGVRADHAEELRRAFGREPMVYLAPHFEDDVAAATKAMLHAVDLNPGASVLSTVSDRLDRLDRRQSRTQGLLSDVANALEVLRSDLRATRAPAGSQVAAPGVPSDGRSQLDLPRELIDLFERVLAALGELSSIDTAVSTAFVVDDSTDNSGLAPIRQIRNSPAEPLQGLGCADLLRSVIGHFRDAVQLWFQGVPAPSRQPLGDGDKDWLDRVCRRYDEVYESLPLHELYGLQRLPRDRRSSTPSPSRDRIRDLQTSIEGLGVGVRQAALRHYGL